MRSEPKIGTKGPVRTGGSGGGLSKASVAAAVKPKPAPKAATPDPKRFMKMETRRNAKALKET